jgi:hypothetical protein
MPVTPPSLESDLYASGNGRRVHHWRGSRCRQRLHGAQDRVHRRREHHGVGLGVRVLCSDARPGETLLTSREQRHPDDRCLGRRDVHGDRGYRPHPGALALGPGLRGVGRRPLGPTRAARFLPSPVAMGIAFLLPASLSLAIFVGSVALARLVWRRPGLDRRARRLPGRRGDRRGVACGGRHGRVDVGRNPPLRLSE